MTIGRFIASLLIAGILGSTLAIAPLAVSTTAAIAQERPKTLFEFLFRNRREARPRREVPAERPAVRTTKRRATAPQTQARRSAPPEPASVEKSEQARTVLVLGDFMAGGLAEGLEEVFAQRADIRVVSRANGSSGLVRDDFYDWPAEAPAILEAEQPAAIVLMLGSNDRQQMRVGDSREDVRSDAWSREYAARAEEFARLLTGTKTPVIWVGLPPFRFSNMSSDMLAFNDVYRGAATDAGAVFVDIWDGFADENGGFVTTGPDINGQPVRLRAGDGINLTGPGKRKIAFYVEKPLARALGGSRFDSLPEPGSPDLVGPPVFDTGPRTIDRTPPIALDDPELDGGDELLGAVVLPATDTHANGTQPGANLNADAPAGRVDNFARRASPAGTAESEITNAVPARE